MKLRILVVDDEKTITDLVGIYLRNEGYDVTLAYTGADAANLILTREFDLAILDVMLPDIDGFELLRTIRADHTYPVIMLTARSAPADKIEGLSLGADDYVVKPFRPLVLVARVKAQLRRYTSYGSRDEQTSRIISINGRDQPRRAQRHSRRQAGALHAHRVLDPAVPCREPRPRRARGGPVPRGVERGVHAGIE